MNRNTLEAYAQKARRDFIAAVTGRAAFYGLTAKNIEPIVEQGDVTIAEKTVGRDLFVATSIPYPLPFLGRSSTI